MNLLLIIIILILSAIFIWSKNNKNKTVKTNYELKSELKLSPMQFVEKFEKLKISGGTLQFWGNWFGRPMDNRHQIQKAEYNNETKILLIILDEEEKIKIWKPSEIKIGKTELRIEKADKILFEWNLYGKEKTNENLRFESYTNKGTEIEFETDYMSKKKKANCSLNDSAFRIIGM